MLSFSRLAQLIAVIWLFLAGLRSWLDPLPPYADSPRWQDVFPVKELGDDYFVRGKVCLITGVSRGGLGWETARALALMGAKRIILASRRSKQGEEIASEINQQVGRHVCVFQWLDLSDISSVHQYSTSLQEDIDIFVLNAGVIHVQQGFVESRNKIEQTFAVNYFGHFQLMYELFEYHFARLPPKPRRVISVTSYAHMAAGVSHSRNVSLDDFLWSSERYHREYLSSFKVYFMSKLAQILFTKFLFKKYQHVGVQTFAVHPGLVVTRLGRDRFSSNISNSKTSLLNPAAGAATVSATVVDGLGKMGMSSSSVGPAESANEETRKAIQQKLYQQEQHRQMTQQAALAQSWRYQIVSDTLVDLFWTVLPGVKSLEQGCVTQVFCASSPQIDGTGQYYSEMKKARASDMAMNPELAEQLWKWSVDLLKRKKLEYQIQTRYA